MENEQLNTQHGEAGQLNTQQGEAAQLNQDNHNPKQTPEYRARVLAAFKGKDGRQIIHAIKNQFPNIRTGDLNMKIAMILDGQLTDEDILKAVEAL